MNTVGVLIYYQPNRFQKLEKMLDCRPDAKHRIQMRKIQLSKILLLVTGGISLVLGVAGIFLPLLPTTPFILLALWAFSKSSQRIHDYIWHHPHISKAATNWKLHGAIPRNAKISALLIILSSAILLLVLDELAGWIKLSVILFLSLVLIWLITRPELPKNAATNPSDPEHFS